MTTITSRVKSVFGLILIVGVLLAAGFLIPSMASAGSTVLPSTVLLSATDNAAGITLQWNSDPNAQKYEIYRKSRGSLSWGPIFATVSNSSATSYTDTTAGVGSAFEYRVVKTYPTGVGSAVTTDEAYVYAGNKAPLVENRGRVILVVDSTHTSALSYELGRLRDDLEGDGWVVARLDVARTDTPTAVRSRISQSYQIDPTNTSHVFLIGHVPVPYSGLVTYDGHPNHTGAWPTDVFYGDIDATWTDTASLAVICPTTSPCLTVSSRTANVPGDGKFDQGEIPSKVELAVGRVDFANMPAFLPQNEKDLLRQYLNKDHLFRIGGISGINEQGYTSDLFPQFKHEQDSWKDFTAILGQGKFFSDSALGNGSVYLLSRFAGGGYPSGIINGLSTTTIVQNGKSTGVFNQVFGSYFGDWDYADNLLRAFIADKTNGLASFWAGFPQWKMYRMGLGETIGESARLSQNIDPNSAFAPYYKWSGPGSSGGTRGIHIALMGDPTLRLHAVKPPSNVTVSGNTLSWNASPDTGILGYNIYRADSALTPFSKLNNSALVTSTSYTNASISNDSLSRYMVRAVKLQSTGSGSYYNASLGALSSTFATLSGGTSCTLGAACMTTGSVVSPAALAISAATPSNITVKQGEVFSATFRYAGGPTAKNWELFTFLADESNFPVSIVHANAPGYPNLTFSQSPSTWSPGVHNETFSFKAPSNLAPGTYRLITGMYDGADRLTMTNQAGFPSAGTNAYVQGYQVATVELLPGDDTTAPVRTLVTPASGTVTLPSGSIATTLSLTTDETAACKYSTQAGTAYSAMTATFAATNIGKTHNTTITGLSNGFSGVYSIRCSDGAGNVNPTDLSVTVIVSNPPTFNVSKTDSYTVSVTKGESVNTQIFITNNSSAPSVPVSFTAAPGLQLPVGVSYSFSPTSCTPNPTCNVSLVITATPSAPTVVGVGTPLSFALYDNGRALGLFQVLLTIVAPTPVVPPTDNPNPPPNPNDTPTNSTATFANPTSLSGWAWSSTVGWLSFSSNNEAAPVGEYGVNRDIYGNLTGYVWASNVGWVKFGDLNTAVMPNSTVAPGTTQTNAKVDPVSGRLSGWARVCSGAQTPSTCSDTGGQTYTASSPDPKGGFTGWISLGGITAAGPYGVQITTQTDGSRRYAGYAWGSTVLGWIQFDIPVPSDPTPQPDIVATCVAPSSPMVGAIATWRATNVSGGNGAYTYTWSGSDDEGPNGSASTASVIYTNPGIKAGSVSVSSGGRTLVVICPDISVAPEPDPLLTATLSASRTTAEIGDSVTWIVEPHGGSGTYEYVWEGSQELSSDGATASIAYTSSGTKTARVTLTSGDQSVILNASMTVNAPPVTPQIVGSCTAPANVKVDDIAVWQAVNVSGATNGYYEYAWAGDGPLISGAATAPITYTTAGAKSAQVTISSPGARPALVTCSPITVTARPVDDPLLEAKIVPNRASVFTGDTVTWMAEVSGGNGVYTYSWSGDPETLSGTESTASVTYTSVGLKNARVTVTSGGQTVTAPATLNVQAPPGPPGTPDIVGSCQEPSGVETGVAVTWQATATGGAGPGTYSYSWQGDGGLNSTGNNATITYDTAGIKSAGVTIFSGDKILVVPCSNITVISVPEVETLTANLSANPSTANVGESVTWAIQPHGGDGVYTYSWSGSAITARSPGGTAVAYAAETPLAGTGESATVAYSTPGQKSATVIVSSGGQSTTVTALAEILALPVTGTPAVTGSCTAPSGAVAGTTATWQATPGGGNGTYSYSWSGTDGLDGTNRTTSIIYPTAGTKNASVTIFSGDKQATISCPAASVALPPPPELVVTVAASPASVYANESVSWTSVVDGCQLAEYTPCTYAWTGDGAISGTEANTTASYATAGTKTGTLTVTSGARQASASATVKVWPLGDGGGASNPTVVIGGGASCIGVCETSSILALTCAIPTRSGSDWTWSATLDGSFKGNQPYKFNWIRSTGTDSELHSPISQTTNSYTWADTPPTQAAQPGQFVTVSVSDASLAVNSSNLISCPAVPQENTTSNVQFGAASLATPTSQAPSDASAYKSSVTTQKGRAVAMRYGISGGNVDDVYLITQSGPAGSGVSGSALEQRTYSSIVPPTILIRGPFNTEGVYKYTLKIFTKGVDVLTGSPKSVSEITVTVRTNPDLNEF